MKVAFYAPLKPPCDPVPSGDRAMARAVLAALAHSGIETETASTLRSRDAAGDTQAQAGIRAQATACLPEVIARGRAAGWQAWVTYHSYYKAPDLIGPQAARALGIPYLLVEATRARKRLQGPWSGFARSAEAACDAAHTIFYLTAHDHEALAAYAPADQRLNHLPPFLPHTQLPEAAAGQGLLAVGMMRVAAKLASYALIARTLELLPETTTLEIAGDGPARPQIAAMMAPFGARVRFLGQLAPAELERAYLRASALIWPGVDEAFGMVYLEAQAHGLAVIAQDRAGVRDVLYPRAYPAVALGPEGLAALALQPPPLAGDIRAYISQHHLLPAAARSLRAGLEQAVAG